MATPTSTPPLSSQQQNFIAQASFSLGFSLSEVAALSGLSQEYLEILSASPLFVAEVDRLKQRFAAQLVASSTELLQKETWASIQVLLQIRDNPMLAVRERRLAAVDILDRVPETSKQSKVTHETNNSLQLTDKQFQLLLKFVSPEDDPVAFQAFQQAQLQAPQEAVIDLPPSEYTESASVNASSRGATNEMDTRSTLADASTFEAEAEIEIETTNLNLEQLASDLSQFLSASEE